ncbi:MAG: RNA-binding protein [Leptolyngbya sp. DLM2.Bin27]|nr:MAG: RNA-binding protein [Leptolyngbya sp. DLM2.Bin27]
MTIYIGNLSFQASEDDIKSVFAEYGEVTRISLPIDRETGRKRGFAFVDMADEAKEDQAISELDGAEWLGRELRVNKARPRTDDGGGSSTGDGSSRPNRSNRFSHNPL